ncbi:tRNA (adenosine(37)-N6)-threonylcarbamoyltransferase complex ATPase subunit type 1 TsaE [Actinomyces sp. MRS3W]|uniref:tRNA (adenosine(37)-N6)-threonylcarbamoyltransferase complex ATPase subunit type 1 TsaE n=1 Tax=Actinomyces sp. MRS3W TaxID=2800796 RepID=UPI0028FDB74B|nr:tRNA (adenosine(37)-N6)-threonylcarbamoyltransferase complex ATPase subunit type 1 TsaE [Actinomyces sp. MRS3W]MDU0347622.1 tRNA (adenosine(37)-N6)-threonylcarbamoyltransferase complex ATPase subunit type 1 TsaE [Actinomyces sp. MRS3W]
MTGTDTSRPGDGPLNSISVDTDGADATRALGARLAAILRAGDVVVLSGGLGAGKTTLAQGVGRALGVRGRVSSPTFVIARVHPALKDGPDLIHVDAYRIATLDELDALDLDSSLAEAVILMEWGEGKAEALSEDRLEITVARPHGGVADAGGVDTAGGIADAGGAGSAGEPPRVGGGAGSESDTGAKPVMDLEQVDDGRRTITVSAVGPRWAGVDLTALAG